MIESATARQLVDLILKVEERLARLLTSGWRQASSEAADLQQEADALAEAGLPALAARVSAVAASSDASSALHAVALAASACQLMRTRLLVSEPPEGWQPIKPPKTRKSRSQPTLDTILPLARLMVGGQEVWACAWPARNQVILLEPPLPPPPSTPGSPADDGDMMSRFQRQLARVFSGAPDDTPPSLWLRHGVQGALCWTARYPLGVTGEIAACTMEDAGWQLDAGGSDQDQVRGFRSALASNTLNDGTALSWSVSSVRMMELDRRDAAAYVWLDPTTAAGFHELASPDLTALVLVADNVVVPLAALRPGSAGQRSRITHLIPGLPSDVLNIAPKRRNNS